MFPEEFIYTPLYNHKELTSDITPVMQPWFQNLMIADIVNSKMEFKKKEEITLSNRKIQEYELTTLSKN